MHFLKLYVDRMWEMECNMKIRNEKMGFWLITFSKNYFDACFSAQIVALDQTRHLRPFSGSVRKNLFLFFNFMVSCSVLANQAAALTTQAPSAWSMTPSWPVASTAERPLAVLSPAIYCNLPKKAQNKSRTVELSGTELRTLPPL